MLCVPPRCRAGSGSHATAPAPRAPHERRWFLSSPFPCRRQGPAELAVILGMDTSYGLLPSRPSFGVKRIKVTFKSPWGHPLSPIVQWNLINRLCHPSLSHLAPLWEILSGPSFVPLLLRPALVPQIGFKFIVTWRLGHGAEVAGQRPCSGPSCDQQSSALPCSHLE